jgi:hypothetical protein
MKRIYMKEFLRLPTPTDLKNIVKLHQSAHSVNGLVLGSLECTHTFWKNCSKALQGLYKGKESKPLIVLEALADYRLFLWHPLYGYTLTLNDTILSLSPLMSRLTDGTFHQLEEETGVAPFEIMDGEFDYQSLLSC